MAENAGHVFVQPFQLVLYAVPELLRLIADIYLRLFALALHPLRRAYRRLVDLRRRHVDCVVIGWCAYVLGSRAYLQFASDLHTGRGPIYVPIDKSENLCGGGQRAVYGVNVEVGMRVDSPKSKQNNGPSRHTTLPLKPVTCTSTSRFPAFHCRRRY